MVKYKEVYLLRAATQAGASVLRQVGRHNFFCPYHFAYRDIHLPQIIPVWNEDSTRPEKNFYFLDGGEWCQTLLMLYASIKCENKFT